MATVKQAVKQFMEERAGIEAKVEELKSRQAYLDKVIRDLSKLEGEAGPSPSPATPRKRTPKVKDPNAPVASMSSDEAILQVLAGAKEPMPAGDVLAKASEISGNQINTLRTRLFVLKKQGILATHPFKGRGKAYTLASGDGKPRKSTTRVVVEPAEPQGDPQVDPELAGVGQDA